MKKLLFIICLISGVAGAADLIKVQYGASFKDQKMFNTESKTINIGYYNRLREVVSYSVQVGYMGDTVSNLNAFYTCGQLGGSLNPSKSFYVETYVGPCVLSETRDRLGGFLQFSTHIGIGWRDPETGNEMGILWKHFSNAGLKKPNKGRDFPLFSMGFSY